MNVRDLRIIHTNLITAIQAGRDYDAYAWTRLLCRQLRPLTVKQDATGTEEWRDAA
jgi:hypothetical protein